MPVAASNPLPEGWEGTTNFGPLIPQWERSRWKVFFAQIATSATSSGDAGVLGNFPQEVEQELRQEVQRLLDLLAEKDEWTEALEEELQRKEQVIMNLHKEITWRDLEIGPESPLRLFYLN